MRGGPGGTLVDRARERLREGPAHTMELAHGVLGLSGPAHLVSTAVFTLLGSDARFRVGPDGVWSLGAGAVDAPGLHEARFAVVDVETTGGGFGDGHRIIEIAVVQVCGGQVGEVWSTLVNPGRWVPRGVQHLTGITEAALAAAPWFDQIATEVAERLEGRVFVAHNAGFDWRFVDAELTQALGGAPPLQRICTLRMARRLLPALRRRNLDELARHYGVSNHARHRADGDALATARVLVRLLDEAAARGLGDLAALGSFLAGAPPGRGRRRRRRTLPEVPT